jgi:hypothetical protein
MDNLYKDDKERSFWCWVDHEFFIADHNYKIGSFTSADLILEDNDDHLMFLKNEKFKGVVSPFQYRLLNGYSAEYNLEIHRRKYFTYYPSRLTSIFLFDSEKDANRYMDRNPYHVGRRKLRKAKSNGHYTYSKHDCSWVDFLRIDGSKNSATLHEVGEKYWAGERVENNSLQSHGKKWSIRAIYEVLYSGRIDFVR